VKLLHQTDFSIAGFAELTVYCYFLSWQNGLRQMRTRDFSEDILTEAESLNFSKETFNEREEAEGITIDSVSSYDLDDQQLNENVFHCHLKKDELVPFGGLISLQFHLHQNQYLQ